MFWGVKVIKVVSGEKTTLFINPPVTKSSKKGNGKNLRGGEIKFPGGGGTWEGH